jgi:hypothetical protein
MRGRSSIRILCALAVLAACTSTAGQGPAGIKLDPKQERFATPDDAWQALVGAMRERDHERLMAILGPGSDDVVSSGDQVADDRARERFLASVDEGVRLEPMGEDIVAHVGKRDWEFPIPLVRVGKKWAFDTETGREELINRRVGRNELSTIYVCRAYVDAQHEYAALQRPPQYAQRLLSSPGKKDGLYWPADGGPESPMGPLLAQASAEGYHLKQGQTTPYHGYYFRILTAQGPHAPGGARSYLKDGRLTGGFALLAYPADYGASGVKSFIVNQQGVIFDKDLGEQTSTVAAAITAYDPDMTWDPVPVQKE